MKHNKKGAIVIPLNITWAEHFWIFKGIQELESQGFSDKASKALQKKLKEWDKKFDAIERKILTD